jgi:hypothetical protein
VRPEHGEDPEWPLAGQTKVELDGRVRRIDRLAPGPRVPRHDALDVASGTRRTSGRCAHRPRAGPPRRRRTHVYASECRSGLADLTSGPSAATPARSGAAPRGGEGTRG